MEQLLHYLVEKVNYFISAYNSSKFTRYYIGNDGGNFVRTMNYKNGSMIFNNTRYYDQSTDTRIFLYLNKTNAIVYWIICMEFSTIELYVSQTEY